MAAIRVVKDAVLTVFHVDADCKARVSGEVVSWNEAQGAGCQPCATCCIDVYVSGVTGRTKTFRFYHGRQKCDAARSVMVTRRRDRMHLAGKRPCSKCYGKKESL